MSQHARIEEVSDSDFESDPSEQDLEDLAPISLPRPSAPTVPTPSQHEFAQIQAAAARHAASSPADDLKIKKYQCIYPLYFDANRSRAQGRRVGKKFAVRNPLAREIVDAVQLLGLDTVFEPGKTHPKDWSNPGRVRVLVKENGTARNRAVQNKHHLYTLISKHLLANPTNPESPLRLRIQGMPPPELPLPTPNIPRGWKMNTVLPLHSPALSGGGVSDNIIKDMMQEIQAGQAGGLQGMVGQRGVGEERLRAMRRGRGKGRGKVGRGGEGGEMGRLQ